MKFFLATVLALAVASPAAAGYRFVTVDGPASPALLGTVVTSINDYGVATGYTVTADPNVPAGALGDYNAFTVNADGSGFAAFSRPGYAQTGAAGINNLGDITGVSVTAQGVGTGFVRSGATGGFIDIDPSLGGITAVYSEAIGLDDYGDYTGYYVDHAVALADLDANAHGFVDIGGVYSTLDVDPSLGYGTKVVSINDFGLITGTYLGASDGLIHPFISDGMSIVPLTDPFGAPSSELGNLNLQFRAAYNELFPTPLSPIGYVSVAYVVGLLDASIQPVNVPGALFTEGFGLNDVNQLTGLYFDGAALHGFIATPIPEPATWALMIAGFGLVGSALRRRPVAARG